MLGSPRSGTTLLYHMILSAGNFAVYHTESNVFNLLVPRFGDLSVRRNREALMKVWLNSKLFERSGLVAQEIETKILDECKNAGDFLRIIMESIAYQQHMERWAECTPDHLFYLAEIKKTIPDALVIHILRDGRDVALSLEKQHWIRPFPWDKGRDLVVAGFYWEWMVRKGRKNGQALGQDYFEVHFEDLVSNPRGTLPRVGQFIDHDLDYDRILRVGLGSVRHPNTSFGDTSGSTAFNPVGRWRTQLTDLQLTEFEGLFGRTLKEMGYHLAGAGLPKGKGRGRSRMVVYESLFSAKLWAKRNTPLGHWLISDDLSWL